jgi:hypothetical protein
LPEPIRDSGRFTYQREIPVYRVREQCDGTCWAHSGMTVLDDAMLRNHQRWEDISLDFILYHAVEQRLRHPLSGVDDLRLVINEDGNHAGVLDEVVALYGMIPSSAWQPQGGSLDGRYSEWLERIQNLFKNYEDRLIVAENSRDRNRFYRAQLDFADAVARSRRLMFGVPPETFQVHGRTYTPRSWADRALPREVSRTLTWVDAEIHDQRPFVIDSNRWQNYQSYIMPSGERRVDHHYVGSVDELSLAIRRSIDSGRPPRLSIEWHNEFIDSATGIISPNNARFFPLLHQQENLHAVVIFGYDLDADGNISRLKILNSHGAGSGDNGFIHMDIDYFRAFARDVTIRVPMPQGFR